MTLITLTGISKAYDADRPLFEQVDLVVNPGDRLGLIGANGCGKSTLLGILAGRIEPEAGERVLQRGLRIGYLEQEPRFEETATVREIVRGGLEGRDELLAQLGAVHDGLARPDLEEGEMRRLLASQERLELQLEAVGGHDVEHRVEATIDGLGLLDADAVCGKLSGGESRRVALARLLIEQPDVLLLDEPTNHLDAFVVAWLEERLEQLEVPLVLVTHDRYLLDRVANRIVEIDRAQAYGYVGGYSRYVEERAARLASEEKAERSRLNLLRRETEWMRRGPLARTTKAKARISRYEDLVASGRAPLPEDLALAFPPGPRLGARVVSATGISHTYPPRDGGEARQVVPELDLEIEQHMRLGVVGPNGAGKTTLLRILLKELIPTTGDVVHGETISFGLMDQSRVELDPEATVVEEIAGNNENVNIGGRSVHVASFLDKFLFPGNKKYVQVGSLSGGERGRLLLAKLMLSDGNVMVLDEPTNDLDLGTLRALEEALVAFPGAVVVVSHDRWFLDRVATHVLFIDGRGKAVMHAGDVSSLLDRLTHEEAERVREERRATRPAREKPRPSSAPPRKKSLSSWEQRELEELTARIETLEEQLTDLDTELARPELWSEDGARARQVQAERVERASALDEAMARWEELAERAD